jgi:amidohydrolase
VSVGTLHAGTAGNIIAERAEFTGILRTLGQESRKVMRTRLVQTVEGVARRHGATCDCALRESYPGVVNDGGMTRLVQDAATALLGAENVRVIAEPTMTTEDFGCFLLERPGSFYHVGAGCALPLHNAAFLPDDGAIVTAAALHAAVADTFLRRDAP